MQHATANALPQDVSCSVMHVPSLGMPQVVDGPDALSKEAQRNATLLFFSHLRATFASKRVLKEYKLTAEAFDWILGEVETRFNMVRDALPRLCQAVPAAGSTSRAVLDASVCTVCTCH